MTYSLTWQPLIFILLLFIGSNEDTDSSTLPLVNEDGCLMSVEQLIVFYKTFPISRKCDLMEIFDLKSFFMH